MIKKDLNNNIGRCVKQKVLKIRGKIIENDFVKINFF